MLPRAFKIFTDDQTSYVLKVALLIYSKITKLFSIIYNLFLIKVPEIDLIKKYNNE